MEVATTDWQAEALRLKGEGWSSASIAEAVGKHPATVRKVINRAPEEPQSVTPEEWKPPTITVLDDREPIAGQTDLADFIEEAGEPVGEMQTRPGEEPAGVVDDVFVEENRVDGTTQFAIDFGGDQALDGTLSISGSFPSGFFRKSDVISGTFTARVVAVTGKDKLDKKSGVVKETGQSHSAALTAVRILTPDDTRRLGYAAEYLRESSSEPDGVLAVAAEVLDAIVAAA